jgi:hypothetical protein
MDNKIYTQQDADKMIKDAFFSARGVFAPYELEGNPNLYLCQTDSRLRLIFNDFNDYKLHLERSKKNLHNS